jgi:hypothetical protein
MLLRNVLGSRAAGLAGMAAGCLALAGCKSDLNQQLLERELRYQEDQIYQLQDELQAKCARLESVAGENQSLRRQLGVSETDSVGRTRPAQARPAGVPPPVTVPPAITIPAPGRGAAPAGGGLAPPALDNIPPLPVKPSAATEPGPLSLPEPTNAAAALPAPPAAPAAVPAAMPVAFDQPLADGRPVRLVVTTAATACFDDNGDGRCDGIAVTFEPRDAEEKLVPAVGAVSITVFDAADPAVVIAT